ncbi:MAG: prepilin-type N-terminal cleavage/methylation domain-containing protein [Lysobacterales bacterium]
MKRSAAGFTLIELLLAILLLGLLMAGAYGGITTATRAVTGGEALIDRTNRVRVAQEFLRRQLRNAMPLAYQIQSSTGETRLFEGGNDTLRFVSTMPGYLSHGGAYVQTLSLRSGRQGGRELVFGFALLNGYEAEHGDDSERDPVVLIEGIQSGGFEYRGLDETGKMSDWRDDWDNIGMMPSAVRLVLDMDQSSRYVWPDLEVAILSNAANAAAADPFLGRFR